MDAITGTGVSSFGCDEILTHDVNQRCVIFRTDTVHLTSQESNFLHVLIEGKGSILTHKELNNALGIKNTHVLVLKTRVSKKLSQLTKFKLIYRHKRGYSVLVPDEVYERKVVFGTITYFPDAARAVSGKEEERKEITISKEKNEVFKLLASRLDQCVSKMEVYRAIVGRGLTPEPRIIDVVICKLRKLLDTLEQDGGHHLETVWGRGLRLSTTKVPPVPFFTGEDSRKHSTRTLVRDLRQLYARQVAG